QAFILRLLLSETIFLLIALYAWRWYQDGRASAAFFLMLTECCADVVFIQVRMLSENAMAVPMMLALLSERRWPRLAGFWWMIVFAVRFQAAFLIVGLVTWSLWENYRRWRQG